MSSVCFDDVAVMRVLGGGLRDDDGPHLDSCARCRELVSSAARVTAPARRELVAGQTLGRFVVGARLGAGAMGEVYAAHQPELRRDVAIKIVPTTSASAQRRLLAEAQAMARLAHPHVVTVYDVGAVDDAAPADGVYVAMELVDGATARGWARGQSSTAIAALVRDVARGVAAAHAAGLVHRDVKPDNIFVGRDGRARIGDFGLAAPPDVAGGVATSALGTQLVGTPAYMAPEVLAGGAPDTRSDQFSVGVTAYELLAGRRPFGGATPAALATAMAEPAPLLPTTIAPRWLATIVQRALARDPAARFTSLDALAAAVDAGLTPRRRPWRWVAVGAGAAVAVGALVWGFAPRDAAPIQTCDAGAATIATTWGDAERAALQAADISAAPVERWTSGWAAALDAACHAAPTRSPAITAAVVRCLDQRRAELAAIVARAGAGELASALAALPDPAACTSRGALTADVEPSDPGRLADVAAVRGVLPTLRAAVALGDGRPALADAATATARATTSGHAPTVAAAALVQADALRVAGQLEPADDAARAAIAAAERGHDDQAAAEAWLVRVAIAIDRRALADAADDAELADAAIARADAGPRARARLATQRGLIAYGQGHVDDATRLLGAALTQWLAIDGATPSVEVARVHSALGSAARAAGRLDEAHRAHQLAYDLDVTLHGPRHPDVARDLHNLAGVLRLRGDDAGALGRYQAALVIERALGGDAHPSVALTRNSIALIYMARAQWADAERELTAAAASFTAAGHGDLAVTLHNLGLVAQARADHAAAATYFDRAAAAYADSTGADTVAMARLPLDRARSAAARGDAGSARRDARAALDGAARVEGAAWIAADATALLRELPTTTPRTVVPPPTDVPAVVPPPSGLRVGVYGSSF